jgi:hypothetical protein
MPITAGSTRSPSRPARLGLLTMVAIAASALLIGSAPAARAGTPQLSRPQAAPTMPAALTSPVYTITPGYTMLGWYPGYSSGRNAYNPDGSRTSNATMASLMSSLGTKLGTNIEAINVGLPNDLGDVTSFVQDMTGYPGYVLGTLPLSPLSGGSLTRLIAGSYDTQYTSMFTKLKNAGLTGTKMGVRLGWEWDGTWSWGLRGTDPATNALNTTANYKAAFQHVVGLARAAGWSGDFDWNGPAENQNPSQYAAMYPGSAYNSGCQVVGLDFYTGISNGAMYSKDGGTTFDPTGTYLYGYPKDTDYQTLWTNEGLPELNSVAKFARDNGLLMGMAEIGDIIKHTSRYAVNQTAKFWPLITGWLAANADVAVYAMPFNQNQHTGTATTEDDQYFYQGGIAGTVPSATWTGPTVADRTTGAPPPSLGSMDNASYSSTSWVDTTSPNKQQALAALKQYWKAGTMQSSALSQYTPLNPCRWFDTRNLGNAMCSGAPAVATGPVAADTTLKVKVTGVGGVPSNASAVSINVTDAAMSGNGYVKVWPDGATPPGSSALNVPDANPLSNFITVQVGAGGYLDFDSGRFSSHLIVDLAGYYGAGSTSSFAPFSPCRWFDSRSATNPVCSGSPNIAKSVIAAGSTVKVKVTGVNGIPTTATAVSFNLESVDTSAAGYVQAWPDGQPQTVAAAVDFKGVSPIANFITVPVGAGGLIDFYVGGTATDLVADLSGYFAPTGTSRYLAFAPCRLFDTRSATNPVCSGSAGIATGAIASGTTVRYKVTGVNGVPSNATAVSFNLAAANATGLGYVKAWPDGQSLPGSTALNVADANTLANFVTVAVGTGGYIDFAVGGGASTDLLADLAGYYA